MTPDERDNQEQEIDRLLAAYDRAYVTRWGRTVPRNPALPYYLAGIAGGPILTIGLAIAGRGGLVVIALLELAFVLLPVLSILLFGFSLLAHRRGRKTAGRLLGIWVSCMLAMLLLIGAARLGLVDSGIK